MDCTQYSFNELEFNLYELLNLPTTCSLDDIKKQFKRLVKKFHPDKITELEEKLYYNITVANHILTNESTREKYDKWLLSSNKSHTSLKNNFSEELQSVSQYFPKNQKEAQLDFEEKTKYLQQRHGDYTEDKRNISSIYKEKEQNRKNIQQMEQEQFSDMKEFNQKFTERKVKGIYSNQIVKSEQNIVPYEFKNSNYTELKDFENIYIKDTQLNYAFSLISVDDKINYDENNASKIDKYNNETKTLHNKKNKISLDDIGF
jgi:curved DNA-binding protein CbpA